MKKMAALLLSAMLISVFAPGSVQAQDQETEMQDGTGGEMQNTDDSGEDDTQMADVTGEDSARNVDDAGEATKDTDNGAGENTADGSENRITEPDGDDQSEAGQPEGGQQTGDDEEEGRPVVPIAVSLPMDSANELYGSLSQFLTLSADQFQIYTVAIIDAVTQQPVKPDGAVQVKLQVPSGYDADRTVVSEISMDGQTPVRTEIACTYSDGQAIFGTDHAGIYVVMEKKEQEELPASLEMTSKVEKLELTKKYPESISSTSSVSTLTANPQTGDDNSVLIWGVVTGVAAVAVIALIVVIIKRRK